MEEHFYHPTLGGNVSIWVDKILCRSCKQTTDEGGRGLSSIWD